MISAILGHTNTGGCPCLQELSRFLEFHTSSFLPLAEGLFQRKGHFTYRVLLYPTSSSTMTPTHRSHHSSILHPLQLSCNKDWPELILVKGKPIFTLDFERGRGVNRLPQPCLAEVVRRDNICKAPSIVSGLELLTERCLLLLLRI